jgi:hypothetical protein
MEIAQQFRRYLILIAAAALAAALLVPATSRDAALVVPSMRDDPMGAFDSNDVNTVPQALGDRVIHPFADF